MMQDTVTPGHPKYLFLALLFWSMLLVGSYLPEVALAHQENDGSQVGFMAGAAKVDITPEAHEDLLLGGYGDRIQGFTGIHDPIFVRVLAFRQGSTGALIVCSDLVDYSDRFRADLLEQIPKTTGVPPERIWLTVTHTHSAPWLFGMEGSTDPAKRAYLNRVKSKILEGVGQAVDRMQPARAGAGKGRANLNVNRVAMMANGSWWLGMNPDGVSDKEVGVVKVETSEGRVIAILANFAVHGTAMGQDNRLVSGDLPGATSHFVESRMGSDMVALWTSGAGGDQCPIYDRVANDFRGMQAMGSILANEIIKTAGQIRTADQTTLSGNRIEVRCPGRRFRREVGPENWTEEDFTAGPEIPIQLSVLMLGKIALLGISGEATAQVGLALKQKSPYSQTLLITHVNGASGYLPDRDSFTRIGYEIQTSEVAPGCIEDVVEPAFLDLLERQ